MVKYRVIHRCKPMIEAVIFDMDGLLIDSEPLWREAEMICFNKRGIPLTEEMCLQTLGLRVDQVVSHWHYAFPDIPINEKELVRELVDTVKALVLEKGVPREGVREVLEFVKGKDVKIALASSSHFVLIQAIVSKLGIRDYFLELYSAEMEEYGKPHPGVYITTAKVLSTVPERCLAFEDSLNGLLAAKSARMKCVCVPDESMHESPNVSIADLRLSSLLDFGEDHWARLNS